MRINLQLLLNYCLQSFSQELSKHYPGIRHEKLYDGDEEKERKEGWFGDICVQGEQSWLERPSLHWETSKPWGLPRG